MSHGAEAMAAAAATQVAAAATALHRQERPASASSDGSMFGGPMGSPKALAREEEADPDEQLQVRVPGGSVAAAANPARALLSCRPRCCL